jgi:hypothetical protein
MAIKQNFSSGDVERAILRGKEQIMQQAINRFILVGEDFVTNARQNHAYTDRTGNLTASMGYLILRDGVEIHSNFVDGIGATIGRKVAADIALRFPKDIVLIVVAGMGYAAYVESKGFDVLTASSITAETELKNSFAQLQKNVNELNEK